MLNNVDELFERLWKSYLLITPTATKIHELLGSTQKEDLINDHIALRTFSNEKVCLEKIAAHFKDVSVGNPVAWYWNFGDNSFDSLTR